MSSNKITCNPNAPEFISNEAIRKLAEMSGLTFSTISSRIVALNKQIRENIVNLSSEQNYKEFYDAIFPTSIKVKFEEFKAWFSENISSMPSLAYFSFQFNKRFGTTFIANTFSASIRRKLDVLSSRRMMIYAH